MMNDPKPVRFMGSALSDLRAFPAAAKREAGYQIDRVQHGHEPDDWKPMKTIGRGVREIRIREVPGTFRVIYVAKFAEAIYVLHAFEKRARRTAKRDVELARERYKDLVERRRKGDHAKG